jgi:hypothetical protein
MTDRKKPGVAFWATVVLVVVLAGYPLSFGPACWCADANWEPVPPIYGPLVLLSDSGPKWIKRPILWWVSLGKERLRSGNELCRPEFVD